MTIQDAISRADELKPNSFSSDMKVGWLSVVDTRVNDLRSRYEDGEAIEDFAGYGSETDMSTPLLVEDAYAELYLHWIFAQIDYFNEEYEKFNASNSMFQAVWSDYERYFNRKHMPRGTSKVYF